MDEIRFVDTTLRDGHQSLWAEQMTTGMMLPVAKQMDEAGFDAIELMSASHLKKCVRELKEDPWDRVRMVAERIKKTPLRLMAGRVNAFEITPISVYELFIERMAANVYDDPIMQKFGNYASEAVFGLLWTRPGLDLKTRTLRIEHALVLINDFVLLGGDGLSGIVATHKAVQNDHR